jgi:hypothetical protein
VALEREQLGGAVAFARQSLDFAVSAHDSDNACWALELAGCALATGDPERAARLLGAAEQLRTDLGGHLSGLELAQHERAFSHLSTSLNPEALAAALDVGRKLSLEDAAALVGQTGSIRPVSTS